MADIATERLPSRQKTNAIRPRFAMAGALTVLSIAVIWHSLTGIHNDDRRISPHTLNNVIAARGIDADKKSAGTQSQNVRHQVRSDSLEDYLDPTSREAERIFLARQDADRHVSEREIQLKKAEALLALNVKSLLDPNMNTDKPAPIQLQVASIPAAMTDLRAIAAKYGGALQNIPRADSNTQDIHSTVNQPHVPMGQVPPRPSERLLVALSIPSDRGQEALASISKMGSVLHKQPSPASSYFTTPLHKDKFGGWMTSPRKIQPANPQSKVKVEIAAGSLLILLELRT